jgi:hypothetical protein
LRIDGNFVNDGFELGIKVSVLTRSTASGRMLVMHNVLSFSPAANVNAGNTICLRVVFHNVTGTLP